MKKKDRNIKKILQGNFVKDMDNMKYLDYSN